MTPAAQHKRAERQRRRGAGEVRVEVWLPGDVAEKIDRYCALTNQARTDVLAHALKRYIA